jgi:hypothetical protein
VIFLDRFLDLDDLAALLSISAVVCTPYRGEAQSVSGVLTFALAAGCAVASTPYRYARDMLADGAGILSDFGDDEGLADAIHTLLGPGGASARTAARQAAAAMAWPSVGRALRAVLDTARRGPLVTSPATQPSTELEVVGAPGTAHLRLLCDDTCVIQHAHHGIPRLEDGYCVDDAARLLPVAAHLAESTGDEYWTVTIGRCLAFLRSAAAGGNGAMRNFMSWDRRWLDDPHHGDHVGRAIWGLGELVAMNTAFTAEAGGLIDELLPAIGPGGATRTIAYAGLGLAAAGTVDPVQNEQLSRLGELMRGWTPGAEPGWAWCEPRLTYDNGRIPEAMLRVGRALQDDVLIENGSELLRWLEGLCRCGGHYRFPGHRGLSDAKRLNWSGDEQPLEAAAMADLHAAWLSISGDHASVQAIERAWTWFLGNNRLGIPVADVSTGAGFDGLGAGDVNKNRGAESTIAFHRCLLTRTAARPAYGLAPLGAEELVIDA